jgi:hypothetical protein
LTKGQQAIRELAGAISESNGLADGALKIVARGGQEDEGDLTV